MGKNIIIGALQMCSGLSPQENLRAIERGAVEAKNLNVNYLLTPEMSVAFGENRAEMAGVSHPFENNPDLERCAQIARENALYLHIGSLAIALENSKFANRSVLFGPDGHIIQTYDKIHLFDADIAGDEAYRESNTFEGGERAVVVSLEGFDLGMSICYDLRFSILYRFLAKAGGGVIAVPAAFTVPTGEAHWLVLLRARAIETGCYIIAAAQGGIHENGRKTYGHSVIVDPWGEIVAQQDNQSPGLIVTKINMERVNRARRALPVLLNDAQFCLSVNHDSV